MKISQTIKNMFDTDFKKSLICIFLIIITCFLITIPTLHVLHRDIATPYMFNGGDVLSETAGFAFINETGTWTRSDRTGAPFGMESSTPITYADNFGNFFKVLLVKLFGNPFVAFNIYYLLLFPQIAIIAFLVMRSMRISHIMSYLGAVTYAFLPAIFLRGQGHLVVSSYQFVPLGILLSYWIFSDENFLNSGMNFWKYRRNIMAIIMVILIGSNGIGYYPIFSCFFIAVTGVSCLIKNKRFFDMIKSVKLCACVAVVFLLNCTPYLLSLFSDTYSESFSRNAEGAEIYGLKIIQMLLPINGHGIEPLQKIITQYNTYAPLVNENQYAYLGIIGAIGFLVLLFVLFTKKYDKRIILLSELNVFAVLLGTVGGLSSVISFTFFRMIRSYNRISVCIAFLTIASVCILCDKIFQSNKVNGLLKKNICMLLVICVFAVSIWEQCDGVGGEVRSIEAIRVTEHMVDDLENYFDEVEDKIGEGAMIYCLPYHRFPEGGWEHNMGNSELYIPYLFTDTLKWSFGSLYGTVGDLWNQKVSQLPTEYMLEQLSICGFDGVYVNGNAYEEEELNVLLGELKENLDVEPIRDNGINYVFSMNKYNEFINANFTDEEILNSMETYLGIFLKMGSGFSHTESNSDGLRWNWCDKNGEIELYNLLDKKMPVNLVFTFATSHSEQYNLYIEYGDNTYTYPISNEAAKISLPIEVVSGKSIVKFSTDAPQIKAPSDPRSLYFRLFDFNVLPQSFVSVYDRHTRFSYSYEEGFYNFEENDSDNWIWCNSKGVIDINSSEDCTVSFSFTPLINLDEEYNLFIEHDSRIYKYAVSNSSEPIVLNFDVSKGYSSLVFSTDAPQIDAPQDERKLYFRLYNPSLKVIEAKIKTETAA